MRSYFDYTSLYKFMLLEKKKCVCVSATVNQITYYYFSEETFQRLHLGIALGLGKENIISLV